MINDTLKNLLKNILETWVCELGRGYYYYSIYLVQICQVAVANKIQGIFMPSLASYF